MSGSIQYLKSQILSSDKFSELKNSLKQNNSFLKNVNGSLLSFIIEYCHSEVSKKIFIISHDNDRIVKLKDDIETINDKINSSVYSTKLSDSESVSKILLDLTENKEFIVLANASDLSNKLISKEKFRDSLIELKKNSVYSFDDLISTLNKYDFNRKDFVDEEGDYSVRGGIIDLFSENMESPVRIEFFGDTIESIREFDINSQRSVREIESIKIGINLSSNEEDKAYNIDETISDYISDDVLIFIDEPEISLSQIADEKIQNELKKFKTVYVSAFSNVLIENSDTENPVTFDEINFDSKPQPEFHSNLKSLYQNLLENYNNGNSLYILASDEHQSKRIKELIEDFEDESVIEQDEIIHHESESDKSKEGFLNIDKILTNNFTVLAESIHNGFIFNDRKIVLYTEHQIFGRYFKRYQKEVSRDSRALHSVN
jgi:transcription-repair coupling factor (superfamily II helicase)